MRPRLRAVIPLVATPLAFVLVAHPAAAEERMAGAGAYVDGGGNPTARASDRGTEPKARSSAGGGGCEWRVVNQDDKQFGVFDPDGERLYS